MNLIDKRLILNFFSGKWRFDREIRALLNGKLMASICQGNASYCPWDFQEPVAATPMGKDDGTKSDWLLYREKGFLDNRENVSASGNVTRQYLYEFSKTKPIKVYYCSTKKDTNANTDPLTEFLSSTFMENGYFHDVNFLYPDSRSSDGDEKNLKDASATVDHECNPDTYKGIIDIINDNRYSSKWTVTGPQKSYEIHTVYERLSS